MLALSMSGDPDAARKQRADLKLTVPVLDGTGLRISYDVDGTPKLMLLDADGVLRGEYTGWGRETPDEVMGDLRRWTPKKGSGSGVRGQPERMKGDRPLYAPAD